MFEAFPGVFHKITTNFAFAPLLLYAKKKIQENSGSELCGSLMSVIDTPQML